MPYARPLGTPTPKFGARTHANPSFAFHSVGGRFSLMVFLPAERAAAQAVVDHLVAHAELFSLGRVVAFPLTRDAELFETLPQLQAFRWMLDASGDVHRAYGALAADGAQDAFWLLVDPSMRSYATGSLADLAGMMVRVQRLPQPAAHAGVELHAPVLIVPRIFEAAFCRELIAYYEAQGGSPSGVMRQVDGITTGVMDDGFKKRRDAVIQDEGLMAGIRGRVRERLVPEIAKAFAFNVTHIERYIVAAYDAGEGGHFRAHRDNDSPGTAHRRFACSINLNAEEFEGADLRFPEFGLRSYRPPTGGAVVFSCSLLHEVTPVTKGRRYATLPFLYDGAAAKIRRDNLHLVAPQSGGRPRSPDAAEADAEPAA